MTKKIEVGLRLKQIRENSGLSQRSLATKCGWGPSRISNYESGIRSISLDDAEVISNALNISPKNLLFGESSNTEKTPQGNAEVLGNMQIWDSKTPLGDDEVALPFLSEVKLSAGNGVVNDLEHDNGFRLRFAKSTLRRYNVEPENAVCVAVHGNSMEPVLPDGSTVGIDCGNKTLMEGKIFAINHNGELFIKKLYRLPGGGLRVYSFNELEYPPREYTEKQVLEQKITIVGRVFWYSVLL
ncbi:XRE family transcriptional regulator [Vibrio campbellii]|jgi:phage repressor protein C with HTH and peptisase S24 domain|uniref:XRE family transcriptional regulator n=1 Tax=Vibrio campbellii TaxID=680 RepID=UPI0002F4D9AD|nr:helix-turn-helix transcriptional regulator [Vibrio campbellii]AXB31562.1 XRE family transcriptional regulator [Vibrio campbellii]|tara:strand:- start:175 stop:897 length:723 start_codon:yes stop_codon:yes gene_type:complete